MTDIRSVATFYCGECAAHPPGTSRQLALPIRPDWPIWASTSHIAGARVYWLCHVFEEPGVGTTPFTDPALGWEDDLAHPRDAGELVGALRSTWRIVERALETWTPDSLAETARRVRADGTAQLIRGGRCCGA